MLEKKPLNVCIGQRIQLARERAGLTQEQLAERIDRSAQFISTVERGVSGPSLETVILLSAALGVSCDYLLLGSEDRPEPSRIASKLAALPADRLAAMDRLIDVLLELF